MDASANNTKKVLVVEDEVPLLNVLLEKLTREGFVALGAENGARGIEVAKREKPDIILLDLVMPEMTGVDALKAIRGEGEWGKQVPVIVLTNLSGNERLFRQLDENKPVHYLIKGEQKMEDLVREIKKLVG